MKWLTVIIFLIVGVASSSPKSFGDTSNKLPADQTLLLDKELPVRVDIYRSNGVISLMLADSLQKLGFRVLDSAGAMRAMSDVMMTVLNPRDPIQQKELSDNLKTNPNYLVEIFNRTRPAFQLISARPEQYEEGVLVITRSNPMQSRSRVFRIPYNDTLPIELLISKTIDSLTSRRSNR